MGRRDSIATKYPQQTKMFRCIVLAACLAVALAGVTHKNDWEGWEKPSFCRGNDCPVYDVIERTENYELRIYRAGRWVSTQVESIDYEPDNGMFGKLFRYISGANVNEEVIEMTSPVLTRVVPGSGPNCKSTFARSFYIEWGRQGSAPAATEDGVYLETLPAMQIYVTSYSGYGSMDQNLAKVIELGNAIGDTTKFQTGFWYFAGYDSPFQPFNRRNEVWLMARN